MRKEYVKDRKAIATTVAKNLEATRERNSRRILLQPTSSLLSGLI